MKRILVLVVCLGAAPTLRADELPPGRWQFTFLAANGATASTYWVLKVDSTAGKSTATVAAAVLAVKSSQVKTFTVQGDAVYIVFGGAQQIVFDGRLTKDGKKVLGTIGTPEPFAPAWLEPTERTELTPADMKKPAGAAGAGLAALTKRAGAEKTYKTYCNLIDPLPETPAGCRITARAVRNGGRIDIEAEVAGLGEPGADKQLRLLLVEEVVHYGGGNKIRMHHHVVRAMPGGTEGKAIMENNMRVKAAVELPELRKTLTSYLDNFVATKTSFPRLIRPMAMHDLRVIALVQDDQTHEILQAIEVNVSTP